ncbi:hypothetical protein [Jannaschia rubra]|uniref:hypothetical protein n=1 Tax=Jannaschia rubra TaxID=282197 RepID=UPI0024910F41|nr:hypothetical protein [Jannaschia rubra]
MILLICADFASRQRFGSRAGAADFGRKCPAHETLRHPGGLMLTEKEKDAE